MLGFCYWRVWNLNCEPNLCQTSEAFLFSIIPLSIYPEILKFKHVLSNVCPLKFMLKQAMDFSLFYFLLIDENFQNSLSHSIKTFSKVSLTIQWDFLPGINIFSVEEGFCWWLQMFLDCWMAESSVNCSFPFEQKKRTEKHFSCFLIQDIRRAFIIPFGFLLFAVLALWLSLEDILLDCSYTTMSFLWFLFFIAARLACVSF